MTLLALIAFVCTVVFLVLGINSMAHGGAYDEAHATRYMTLRVAAQGAAIALLLLAMLASLR